VTGRVLLVPSPQVTLSAVTEAPGLETVNETVTGWPTTAGFGDGEPAAIVTVGGTTPGPVE
jgi:hypothetical protein